MRALITGVAGFIGSHLAEALLAQGHAVVGLDCFTNYYDPALKRHNLTGFQSHPAFQFIQADLVAADLSPLLRDVDWVFHQAAQAGVRASWGKSFDVYTKDNVLATQRLLEAAKDHPLRKLVYASSSSIYGDAESFPTPETALPRPLSPYGVTKLAAEHLCYLYWRNYGVPTVSLRYFSVYGPRQRPDMAFHKFGRALLQGDPIAIYGDGRQTRDFTFVSDVVRANLLAAEHGQAGEVYNIGGGARVSLLETLKLLEHISQRTANADFQSAERGDARHTAADISKAQEQLGYQPAVDLPTGLAAEVAWLEQLLTRYIGATTLNALP